MPISAQDEYLLHLVDKVSDYNAGSLPVGALVFYPFANGMVPPGTTDYNLLIKYSDQVIRQVSDDRLWTEIANIKSDMSSMFELQRDVDDSSDWDDIIENEVIKKGYAYRVKTRDVYDFIDPNATQGTSHQLDAGDMILCVLSSSAQNGPQFTVFESNIDQENLLTKGMIPPQMPNVSVGQATTTSDRSYPVQLSSAGRLFVNVPWANTTYSNLPAQQGGTAVSLVTTGEKSNWNSVVNKLANVSFDQQAGFYYGKDIIFSEGAHLIAISRTASEEKQTGGIELREYNRGTTGLEDTLANAPGITFHWGGVTSQKLYMNKGGALRWGNATVFTSATSRTLWGQTFDGTANVSGNMTGVGTIAMGNALTMAGTGLNASLRVDDSVHALIIRTDEVNSASNIILDADNWDDDVIFKAANVKMGEVGNGTYDVPDNPTNLDVIGSITLNGNAVATEDRLKWRVI